MKPPKTRDPIAHYTGIGVACGLCFGVILGAVFGNTSTGIAIGLGFGVIVGNRVGVHIHKKTKEQDR